jgi:formimidoylglutamate deiminase
MSVIHATQALLPQGWGSDVRLVMDDGRFATVEPGRPPEPGDVRAALAMPGMPNLHSHAFQRGMAGLAERRGAEADSFWSWRETMYRFALSITPEQVEAVACQLYVEMLESGFCRVGEFHYLHHDRDGRAYADPAEMASRIVAAAQRTGIGLTLLPVFYAHAGFGRTPPDARQRRFVSSLDGYARLLEGARDAIRPLAGAVVGVAPHSLRAVTPEELAAVAALAGAAPVHIHAAEQTQEVADCLAWSGARPVEWLLDHGAVDARWCLVHATHMTDDETLRMAASGAVAGLCPITEANLGDGIFGAVPFTAAGGRFGIGSDSNVLIGVADELRQLEYSQRLLHRARNTLADDGGSTGRALFDAAARGGAAALGVDASGLAAGAPADVVTLDPDHPALAAKHGDAVLDGWIFAGGKTCVDALWIGGRQLVAGGRHRLHDEIGARFRATMPMLQNG